MNTQTMKVQYRGGYSKAWDSPANSPGLYRTNPVSGEVTFHSQYWKAGAPSDCIVDELVNAETGEEIVFDRYKETE